MDESVKAWLRATLSESDGSPSSSRLIAFLWAIILLGCFAGWGTYVVLQTKQMPPLEGWGAFMGFAAAGGAAPYLANQLRRGMSERPPGGA